ncbi:hypothetical protein J1N35_000141 [Gossypium stocksii]|uniref:Uncharacterized protein n=1 Tax=Gossypium stocksii TaxID=47602 RepID=A0A9D4AKI3_9ROSI|nr:hypothetical protein J1N35_000141 [Gossypium stocksii]
MKTVKLGPTRLNLSKTTELAESSKRLPPIFGLCFKLRESSNASWTVDPSKCNEEGDVSQGKYSERKKKLRHQDEIKVNQVSAIPNVQRRRYENG